MRKREAVAKIMKKLMFFLWLNVPLVPEFGRRRKVRSPQRFLFEQTSLTTVIVSLKTSFNSFKLFVNFNSTLAEGFPVIKDEM